MSPKRKPKLSRPLKRSHRHVDPEFPPVPLLTFNAVTEFAEKSQLALASLSPNAFRANAPYLILPRISPHGLQSRFNMANDSVFVVMRKAYPILKNQVNSLNLTKKRGLYIRGPVGVGKSYLLYTLAAEYRLNRDEFRVTYINTCAYWSRNKYQYFLRELSTSFYNDNVDNKSVVQWCQSVSGIDKEDKALILLIEALIDYVCSNNLQWIVICDQYNALFNPSIVKESPFNVIDLLADNCSLNIKVIVSASANNKGYPTEMYGWQAMDIPSNKFDNDEFQVWCNQYLPKEITSDEMEHILFWTGGIPYELNLLLEQPGKTLKEMTKLYYDDRYKSMTHGHRKFCLSRVDVKDHQNLIECVSHMALGISAPKSYYGMDCQLLDVTIAMDGHKVITALNPIAHRVLLDYHELGILPQFKLVTKAILEGDYPNDVKGRIVEKYITTVMEVTKTLSFQYSKPMNSRPCSTHSKLIKIQDVIHFVGNKLPMPYLFLKQLTTLFVPMSPNYPGFDFFIWDSTAELLMAFQVTIKNPFTSHSKVDGTRENCQLWLDFCFGGLDHKPVQVYWIIPKPCFRASMNFKDCILYLEDLVHDIDIVKLLKLS